MRTKSILSLLLLVNLFFCCPTLTFARGGNSNSNQNNNNNNNNNNNQNAPFDAGPILFISGGIIYAIAKARRRTKIAV